MAAASRTEEDAARDIAGAIRLASRRTVLCALVLNGLLWCLAFVLGRSGVLALHPRLGLWSLFAWSLVVTVYATYSYLRARKYIVRVGVGQGLIDSLTGLPNRQALIAEIQSRDVSSEDPASRCRLVDVDLINLNKVNHEFGQMVGDRVLKDIADILRSVVPKENLLGRLGGDEFLIVMPQVTGSTADSLADSLDEAIGNYKLDLGDQGIIDSVKAKVTVGPYTPEQTALHEAVARAKESTAHGGPLEGYYHVPRVTLGAFAVHRWAGLSEAQQRRLSRWRQDLNDAVSDRMAVEIMELLEEKAEEKWVDFVTAVPAPGGAGGGRTYPARELGQAVARHLGVPYRETMRAESSWPETRTIEPVVDVTIRRGEGALLIADVVTSGILERRCVKRLSGAGAHVYVVAWAAH